MSGRSFRRNLSRRKFLGGTASAGAALLAAPMIARAATKEVLIAEPVHGTGYLQTMFAITVDFP